MGIQGLWPILESASKKVELEALEGKKVAVDVSIWLYQANLGFSPDSRSPHIELLLRRLAKLIFYIRRAAEEYSIFRGTGEEQRRMKRHADDILLTKEKMKHLQDLASSSQTGEDVEKIAARMRSSPQKKRRMQEGDEAVFGLPQRAKPTEVVDVSDDDVQILTKKEEAFDETIDPDNVLDLVMLREKKRSERLMASQLPEDSVDFSQFQLQRLLGRNHLNQHIEQLKKDNAGSNVLMRVSEGKRRQHLITRDRDDECEISMRLLKILEDEEDDEEKAMPSTSRMTLCLGYLESGREKTQGEDEKISKDEQHDINKALAASLAESSGRQWMSKSEMMQDLMKRRIGRMEDAKITSQEEEGTGSSDYSSSEFLDVSDGDWQDITNGVKGENYSNPGRKNNSNTVEGNSDREEDVYCSGTAEDRKEGFSVDDEEDGRPGMHSSVGGLNRESQEDVSTSAASRELQEFLTAAGFPWIEAPGEAEAQCVFLENARLVDAVVSDDSDCIAFGVEHQLRHMFNRERELESYEAKEIRRLLGFSRWDAITIAMLSGGDYAEGMRGVGCVSAIELMAEFSNAEGPAEGEEQTLERLRRIEKWLLEPPTVGIAEGPVRRRLRQTVERSNSKDYIRGLANQEVLRTYAKPTVDDSMEEFRWRTVDLERLKGLLWKFLGWDADKLKKTVEDAFLRWNEMMTGKRSYQTHVTSYFKKGEERKEPSNTLTKRVVAAIETLKKKTKQVGMAGETLLLNSEQSGERKTAKSGPRFRGRGRGSRQRGGGRGRGEKRGGGGAKPDELRMSSSSSEE